MRASYSVDFVYSISDFQFEFGIPRPSPEFSTLSSYIEIGLKISKAIQACLAFLRLFVGAFKIVKRT